jgi:hypothetical protein
MYFRYWSEKIVFLRGRRGDQRSGDAQFPLWRSGRCLAQAIGCTRNTECRPLSPVVVNTLERSRAVPPPGDDPVIECIRPEVIGEDKIGARSQPTLAKNVIETNCLTCFFIVCPPSYFSGTRWHHQNRHPPYGRPSGVWTGGRRGITVNDIASASPPLVHTHSFGDVPSASFLVCYTDSDCPIKHDPGSQSIQRTIAIPITAICQITIQPHDALQYVIARRQSAKPKSPSCDGSRSFWPAP